MRFGPKYETIRVTNIIKHLHPKWKLLLLSFNLSFAKGCNDVDKVAASYYAIQSPARGDRNLFCSRQLSGVRFSIPKSTLYVNAAWALRRDDGQMKRRGRRRLFTDKDKGVSVKLMCKFSDGWLPLQLWHIYEACAMIASSFYA